LFCGAGCGGAHVQLIELARKLKAPSMPFGARNLLNTKIPMTFMFWGAGLFVMPLTLIYTLVVCRLFRGRVAEVGYE
jgi:hypothetical protein